MRDRENKLNTQLKRTKQHKLRQYNHSRIHNKTSTIERQNELRDSEVVRMIADGNCFFCAISYGLYQDQSHHSEICKEIVTELN